MENPTESFPSNPSEPAEGQQQVTLFSFDPGQVATASGRVYYCHDDRGICTVEHISLTDPYLARVVLQPIAQTSVQVDNFRRLDFTEFARLGYDLDFVFPETSKKPFSKKVHVKVVQRPSVDSPDVVVDQEPTDHPELDYYPKPEDRIVEDGHFPVPTSSYENLDPLANRRFYVSNRPSPRSRPSLIKSPKSKTKKHPSQKKRPYPSGVRRRRSIGPVTCHTCGKAFGNYSTLERHATMHSDVKQYNCVECNKDFKWESDYKRHMKEHSGSLIKMPCKVCGKSFDCRSRLVRHEMVHSKEKPHTCETCGQMFKHLQHMKKHQLFFHEGHTIPKPYKCMYGGCEKSFESLGKLVRHKMSHTDSVRYPCTFCEKSFKYDTDLKRHIRLVHCDNPELTEFKCEECGKVFNVESRLKRHMSCHSDERPFACEYCGKKFKWSDDMKKHERIMHAEETNTQKLPCTECSKTFLNQSHLQRHMVTHSDEKPFECGHCEKAFKWEADLKKHLKTHDPNYVHIPRATPTPSKSESPKKSPKPRRPRLRPEQMTPVNLTCTVCEMVFKHRGLLNRHMVSHTGERPHLCEECGKSFKYRSDFNKHKKSHLGTNPMYDCDDCGRSFDSKQKIERHALTHTKKRPFSCIYCHHSTKTLVNLRKHQSLHLKRGDTPRGSDEPPSEKRPRRSTALVGPEKKRLSYTPDKFFECPDCDEQFITKTFLNKHRKSVHGNIDSPNYSCVSCDLNFDTKLQLNQHSKFEHNDTSTYICRECGEVFNTDRQLRNHRKSEHENA